MEAKTLNIYMCDTYMANGLRKIFDQKPSIFGKPKLKIFSGREWWLLVSDDEIEPSPTEGEKMDYIFMTVEKLKKYYSHPVYQLDLKKVLNKYGNDNTKVILFSCCSICKDFVQDMYKDISIDFQERGFPVEDIIEKYFTDYLAID